MASTQHISEHPETGRVAAFWRLFLAGYGAIAVALAAIALFGDVVPAPTQEQLAIAVQGEQLAYAR
ncbi:MAG: hypothetical protein KGL46_11240 [Hyphomicrobiales bacterium]|nr:hypothetical protein [Hyphomicrobiales bacterium]